MSESQYSKHRRGPWSQQEDQYLVQLVHNQGALNWVRIASMIGSRSPKQCRERYHQNLKPTLNHEPITPEEGLLIERMVAEMGKRWAEIARRLHGRSDNAVKNWWNGSMNRRRRMVVRRTGRFEEPEERRPYSSHSNSLTPRAPLSIHPTEYNHRRVPSSLMSPAASEVSMDLAPSLISDTGSAMSISPRVVSSPGLDLAPMHGGRLDSRRPSVYSNASPRGYFTEADHPQQAQSEYQGRPSFGEDQRFHERYQASKDFRPSHGLSQSPLYQSNTLPRHASLAQRQEPMQLPPIQAGAAQERKVERDTRMNLSNLLG